MTHPTPVHEILSRVERRELQVDVAAARLFELFGASPFETSAEARPEETPGDAIGQAVRSGPPEGTLSTYNAMEHNRADNGEGVPLSDDQLAELAAAEEAGDDDLAETLREEGYEVVEGADAVREALDLSAVEGDVRLAGDPISPDEEV